MHYVFFLDDDENRIKAIKNAALNWPEHELVIARTAIESFDLLPTKKVWQIIFLDHDLGGKVHQQSGEGTGYAVLQFIKAESILYKQLIYHTMNPAGARNMTMLEPMGQWIPFSQLVGFLGGTK